MQKTIGKVSIGVGYSVDEQGPKKVKKQFGDLEASIGGLDAALKRLRIQSELAGKGLNKAGNFGAQAQKNMKAASQEVAGLGGSVKDLNPAFGSANNAVFQFSRGLEDAAFGIVGVANNIPITIEAFSNLQRQAKAAGVTVKSALVSSLLGPAGLILALSAASFAAIKFGDQIKAKFKSTTKSILSDTKKLKDELNSLFAISNNQELKFTFDSAQDALSAIKTLRVELEEAKKLLDEAETRRNRAQVAVGIAGGERTQEQQEANLKELETARQLVKVREDDVKLLEEGLKTIEAQTQRLQDQEAIVRRFERAGLTQDVDDDTGGKTRARNAPTVKLDPFSNDEVGELADKVFESLKRSAFAAQQEMDEIFSKPLPPLNTKETVDSIDKYVASVSVIGDLLKAGVITEQQAVNEELATTTQLLRTLAAEGEDITGPAYEFLTEKVKDLRGEVGALNIVQGVLEQQAKQLGEAMATVFVDSIAQVNDLESALRGLKRTLSTVLNSLVSAGITAGLGSLFGFGSFGTLFGQALGFSGGGAPRAARGGVVTGTTHAIVGERPEAIMPLQSIQPMIDNAVRNALTKPVVGGGGLSAGNTIRFEFDPVRIANEEILLLVREAERQEAQYHGI